MGPAGVCFFLNGPNFFYIQSLFDVSLCFAFVLEVLPVEIRLKLVCFCFYFIRVHLSNIIRLNRRLVFLVFEMDAAFPELVFAKFK